MMHAFVSDPRCERHIDHSVEVRQRWRVIDQALSQRQGWVVLTPFEADDEPSVLQTIGRVHNKSYVRHVERTCKAEGMVSNDVDVSNGSWPASLAAAGAVIVATDAVLLHDGDGPAFVFCNVRPPGHHAGCRSASGFCLFNNVVVGARHALDSFPDRVKGVAILDIDVHPGDGTMNLLRQNHWSHSGEISYYSVHQRSIFPGGRKFSEARLNYQGVYLRALDSGCTWNEYEEVLDELLEIMSDVHAPDLVIISCGFDSCVHDDLGGFPLKPKHYGVIARKALAVCPKVVSVLEGGYHLKTLAECVNAHLDGASI